MISKSVPVIPLLETDELARIWYRKDRRLYDRAPRRLAEFNIFLCLSGQIQYFINNDLLSLGPHSLLIAHPEDSHFLVKESDDADMIVAAISLELSNSGLHPRPELAKSDEPIRRIPKRIGFSGFNELTQLAALLIPCTERAALNTGISWWFYRLSQHWDNAQTIPVDSIHKAAARALAIIDHAPSLSIADIADQVGMSTTHLGQLFRKQVGMTMTSYRTLKRIEMVEQACRTNVNLPLLSAAFDAGFTDYSAFYRAYVKLRGQNPGSILSH